jgi:hypothetical protein
MFLLPIAMPVGLLEEAPHYYNEHARAGLHTLLRSTYMAANINDAISSLTAQLAAGTFSLDVYTAAIAAMTAAVGRQAAAAPKPVQAAPRTPRNEQYEAQSPTR